MLEDFKNINLKKSYFISDSYDDIDVFKYFENNYLIINDNYDNKFDKYLLTNNIQKVYV